MSPPEVTTPEALGDEHGWLLLTPGGQAGPYSVDQMAQLIADSRMDWASLVWRPGLKGWRPARRDPLLVTGTAAARGESGFGDTVRVSTRRPLLPAADTLVQAAPPAMAGAPEPGWPALEGERTQLTPRPPDAPPPGVPVAPPPPAPLQAPASAQPRLADAFRSAPSLMATHDQLSSPESVPVPQRRSSPHSWLPSAQSMLLVAVVAFAAGVLVAALWGRFAPAPVSSSTVIVGPVERSPRDAAAAPVQEEAPAEPAPVVAVSRVPPPPTQALPQEAELRRELRRVSADVRRCVDDLKRGAELEIVLEGSSGRVQTAVLRTPGLTPGRVECITQAVRQMEVPPFTQPEYRLLHRFAYGP